MNTKHLLILMLIMTFVSCEKNESIKSSILKRLKGENGLSYNESVLKWSELKTKNGNTYMYQITYTSWTGFSNMTELKVTDGIVTSRVYKEFKINETTKQGEIIDSYTETTDNLGSHTKGAAPLTIDELYNTCANEYLIVDEDKNTIYFETELNGMMTLCGFIPNACMDDCYRGIKIDSFAWSK